MYLFSFRTSHVNFLKKNAVRLLEHHLNRCRKTSIYISCKCFCNHDVLDSSKHLAQNHKNIYGNLKWKIPKGYPTPISVYNRILKKNVPLVLRYDDLLTWYTCGPTVYGVTHIGHASTYVKFDIIRRILIKFFNIDVVMVMGITDIDDKIIMKCRELNMDHKTLARQYEVEFFQAMSALKVLPPTVKSRVTEHIPEIITFVRQLIDKNFAYATKEGSVYFAVSKYSNYGKLSQNEQIPEYIESFDKLKRHHRDFALWKAAKPGEPWWQSPWGKGRPGWHIECSAMASSILGKVIDIHSGGIDLLFPHHENEDAQCGACYDVYQWVNYWMHSGHLHLKNEKVKMSKSLKNIITLEEISEKYTANHFRIMCLTSNYKNKIEYSDSVMQQAVVIANKIESFFSNAESYIDGHLVCDTVDESKLVFCLEETKFQVRDSFSTDFDTARALKVIMNLISETNKIFTQKPPDGVSTTRSSGVIAACYSYVERILSIVGLQFRGRKSIMMGREVFSPSLPQILDSVVKFRSKVRSHALKTGKDSQAKSTEPVSSSKSDSNSEKKIPENVLPELCDHPPEEKGDHLWMTKSANNSKVPKVSRKEPDPMLVACDEIRNELMFSGIRLKDFAKDRGSWSLHEDRTLLKVRTSLSEQDPYEPQYKPKPKDE